MFLVDTPTGRHCTLVRDIVLFVDLPGYGHHSKSNQHQLGKYKRLGETGHFQTLDVGYCVSG